MGTLDEELREIIEYTEELPPQCKDCIFSEEIVKNRISPMWNWMCNRNPDMVLSINSYGRCNNFETPDEDQRN